MNRIRLLFLFALCTFAPSLAQTGGGWVARRGMQFYETPNAESLRTVGVNMWYAPLLACASEAGDTLRLNQELDKLNELGIRLVRIPWDTLLYNMPMRKLLSGYDHLLSLLAARGMKAVICLPEEEIANKLLTRTSSLTHRAYTADPTIFSWEIACSSPTLSPDKALPLAEKVKGKDSLHLVSICNWQTTASPFDAELCQRIFTSSAVDYISLQLQPLAWHWTTPDRLFDALSRVFLSTDELLDNAEHIARKTNKPCVISAVNYPRDNSFCQPLTSTTSRDTYLSFLFSSLAERQSTKRPPSILILDAWGGMGVPSKDEPLTPKNYTGDFSQMPGGQYSIYTSDSTSLKIIQTGIDSLRKLPH